VEASVVQHPAGLGRHPIAAPLLRLRTDDQLLAQFRAGNDAAFDVLHDRYRQRLFAYARQMLSAGTRQDAEDVLQDVFVRAYGALRADGREMNVRAWLYRVAHNRCIDHMRRPTPPAAEVYEVSRKPLHDPVEEAQRREDLSRLVEDIGRLPDQQRSALLMRELDGMSYADLADALDVTVPAIKSLLVRARVGLVDAAEARDAACVEIRADLAASCDRGVKASSRARRHLRTCTACAEYRTALRGMRRSFAALSPVGFGPLALGAKLLGAGGAGGGAAAGSSAAAGGGAVAAGATACKVAAVVCTAALAGSAVEADHLVAKHHAHHARVAAPVTAVAAHPVVAAPVHASSAPVLDRPTLRHGAPAAAAPRAKDESPAEPVATADPAPTPADADTTTPVSEEPTSPTTASPPSGGTAAPTDGATPSDTGGSTPAGTTTTTSPPPSQPATGDGTASSGGGGAAPPSDPADTGSGDPTAPPATH
jgi:RNA polymerase sigma factor (sigma-70 family)